MQKKKDETFGLTRTDTWEFAENLFEFFGG